MQRRNFLRLVGGGTIAAATAGGVFAATRTPTSALAPWSAAGTSAYADPRMNALSYAILAPNPHNRQPWLIELAGDDTVILRFDTDRQLPHTDPLDRQLTIGLGCFLELMTMAAGANGYAVQTELFPEGEDPAGLDGRPVAIARFTPDDSAKVDALWAHVPHRRSLKEPFDTSRAVPAASLDVILGSARASGVLGGTIDPGEIAEWRRIGEEALVIEIETPHTYKESVDLFRIGKAEVQQNPDGIDFSGATFDILSATGLFTRTSALDQNSMTFNQGMQAVLDNVRTAMGFVWMVTPGNSRSDQIRAGGDWLRVNLAATSQGLGFQPLSQALQEYPEMDALYRDVHNRLAPNGGTVQMLARIGYGPDVPVSPRWPLEAKLVPA